MLVCSFFCVELIGYLKIHDKKAKCIYNFHCIYIFYSLTSSVNFLKILLFFTRIGAKLLLIQGARPKIFHAPVATSRQRASKKPRDSSSPLASRGHRYINNYFVYFKETRFFITTIHEVFLK